MRSPTWLKVTSATKSELRKCLSSILFHKDPEDRLYRTGELGRYLPDGVEWAGRNDRRVNIRGFRVELEESNRLKRHPAVKDAAVVLQRFRDSRAQRSKLETKNLDNASRLRRCR